MTLLDAVVVLRADEQVRSLTWSTYTNERDSWDVPRHAAPRRRRQVRQCRAFGCTRPGERQGCLCLKHWKVVRQGFSLEVA